MSKKLLATLFVLIAPFFTFAQGAVEKGMDQKIDEAFGNATNWFVEGIFWAIPFSDTIQIPWVLIVLILGALYFTIYFKFINFRGFFTSVGIVRGKYDNLEEGGHVESSDIFPDSHEDVIDDNPDTIRVEGEHEGEVSHFQALTAALSATVGLGNIAGVAVALSIGGPGATFWMILAGFFGMSSKFVECTLGVKYREIGPDGTVYGGPMYYLKKGLNNWFGGALAVIFAIMCIGGSFGGGNMFQSNQAFAMVENVYESTIPSDYNLEDLRGEKITFYNEKLNNANEIYTRKESFFVHEIKSDEVVLIEKINTINDTLVSKTEKSGFEVVSRKDTAFMAMSTASFIEKGKRHPLSGNGWIFGLIMSVLVGIVIIGGIKKIASVTDKIVPFMVGIYTLAVIAVLIINYQLIPAAFGQIFSGAFGWSSVAGGAIGVVLIQGFKRAAFSNEAGIGSASIAHSAVKTKHPASEGLVALLEPFIDTVLVCTMTALVIIISNFDGEIMNYGEKVGAGVEATSNAFAMSISWFPYVLTVAVVLFAFSSMISWSYYGFQAWSYLFGKSKVVGNTYKFIFCLFVIVGSASSLGSVINFSDAMIFAMLVPNMIGLFFLAPKVKEELNKYMTKIKASKAVK